MILDFDYGSKTLGIMDMNTLHLLFITLILCLYHVTDMFKNL